MTNLPEPEARRTAAEIDRDLHHGVASAITYAATSLLCDTLGGDLSSPQFQLYLLARENGRLVVDWYQLHGDLSAGLGPTLDRPRRGALLMACEIATRRLGALLGEMDAERIGLFVAALQALAARIEPPKSEATS